MHTYLKTLKIFFAAGVGLLIMLMVFTMVEYHGRLKLDTVIETAWRDLKRTLAYASYTSEFEGNTGNVIAANLAALIGIETETIAMEAADGQRALSVPVLVYHGIVEEPDGSNILTNDFKEQMFALKRAGWETVSLEDFSAFMRGEKDLPDKSFLLTFDDGRKDSYYPSDPILRALGYRAVIFVITGHSLPNENTVYYLAKSELAKMLESGRWEVEVHTKDGHDMQRISENGAEGHFYSDLLWLAGERRLETPDEFTARIADELSAAKQELESELGVSALGFAYPFGDYGQDTKNFPDARYITPRLTAERFPFSFYQVRSDTGFSFNYPDEDDTMVRRIEVGHDWNAQTLIEVLESGREKTLPYTADLDAGSGWTRTWGDVFFTGTAALLGARADTAGSSLFLDGSRSWRNYTFRALLDWIKGNNVLLLARYQDEENYLACNFSDTGTRIEQRIEGNNSILAERTDRVPIPRSSVTLGIAIIEDEVTCLVNEVPIVSTPARHITPERGGVGFKTWDPSQNNSGILIREVFVE